MVKNDKYFPSKEKAKEVFEKFKNTVLQVKPIKPLKPLPSYSFACKVNESEGQKEFNEKYLSEKMKKSICIMIDEEGSEQCVIAVKGEPIAFCTSLDLHMDVNTPFFSLNMGFPIAAHKEYPNYGNDPEDFQSIMKEKISEIIRNIKSVLPWTTISWDGSSEYNEKIAKKKGV